ncbi:unnamed protein product [Dracunculus medinensis]|uniref:3'-5' exonuclease domain-containing protein n=1 Tax=Dracunculus medinensis TaxID=318479 RepID=A0A0N4U6M6_DRAME|nr:unnamed protein product [Dracunculus medinensis]
MLNDGSGESSTLTKEKRKLIYGRTALEEPLNTWICLLKDIWRKETDKALQLELSQSILYEIFDGNENPFEAFISLYRASESSDQKRATLCSIIVKNFGSWLEKCAYKDELYKKFMNQELKELAFSVGTHKSTENLETFIDIFEMNDLRMINHVYYSIKEMMELNNYLNAVKCAIVFKLESYFTIQELAVPCILQDLSILVEKLLENNKISQIELVKYFDQFIGLSKTAANIAPRFIKSRQESSLRYIVYQRFKNAEISEEGYFDFVRHAMQNRELQIYFVNYLVDVRQYEDAVFWTIYCNMFRKPPRKVLPYLNDNHMFVQAQEKITKLNANLAPNLDKLELFKGHPIKMIDTIVKLDQFLVILQNSPIIGYDSEFKPSFLSTEVEVRRHMTDSSKVLVQIALIQISVPDCSYLLDVIALEGIMQDWQWLHLFRLLFCREESIVLGFAFQNDIHALCSTFPVFKQIQHEIRNVICIMRLLLRENAAIIGRNNAESFVKNNIGGEFCHERNDAINQSFSGVKNEFNQCEPADNEVNQCELIEEVNQCELADKGVNHCEVADKKVNQCELTDKELDVSSSDKSFHFRLTDLCRWILGEDLDKREQIGNWAVRPLRMAQLRYAALDAFCLIKLYEKLKVKAIELSMDWERHINIGCINAKFTGIKKPKKKKKCNEERFQEAIARVNAYQDSFQNIRGPRDVKIIVDTMFLGLGKHLRRCGVDTLLAYSRDELIGFAREDTTRIILTCGKSFDQLNSRSSNSGFGKILCVPSHNSVFQQLENVLKILKLRLTREDIFSRCMNCNSNIFVIAPAPVLEALYYMDPKNLYRMHNSFFMNENEKYFSKIRKIDPNTYSGYGCKLVVDINTSSAVAYCYNGLIDLSGGLVKSNKSDYPVFMRYQKFPPNVYEEIGRYFFSIYLYSSFFKVKSISVESNA